MNDKDIGQFKVAVHDVLSHFYNGVIEKRFESIDQGLICVKRLTSEALVKVVEYSKLQTRVTVLEDRLNKLESQLNMTIKTGSKTTK